MTRPSSLEPGAVVAARYAIRRRIGGGGMGDVFEAVHTRLDLPVAIKVLLPELATNERFVRRFEREARAVARLRSAHVVRIHDVDATADGVPFMVMELLEGRDLGSAYESGPPIEVSDVVRWAVQACDALAEAHAEGIVHRDVKPSNVFLCEGGRCAKLVDFGLAKDVHPAPGDPQTGSRELLGTPQYMAPERMRTHARVDGRADLWSLGVILYRMISGSFPFQGTSWPNLAVAIASEAPAPLLEVVPEVPPELARAVMRALEKDPRDRFADASEMARALAPFAS